MNLKAARQGIINTLDIMVKIDYNTFLIEEMSKSETMTKDEIFKFSVSRLRSNIRYKKILGYDVSNELTAIKQLRSACK